MRRTRLALWLTMGLTSIVAMLLIAGSLAPLTAQPLTRFFEQITVDSTSGGKGFTAAKITPPGQPQMTIAVCTLESAGIRYTVDGTTVTSTVGMPLAAGTSFQIIGHDALVMFRAIRATGSNGTLSCLYSTNQTPLVVSTLTPIGGGGSSGGGSGGAVTIADGADVALGTTTDSAVVSNSAGTAISFLRGLVTLANTGFTVLTHAVTQSGTWTANLRDGSGNAITSTASALDINVKSSSLAAATPIPITALTTTQTVIGTPKILDSWYCGNGASQVAYLQVFDTSGAVTLGATVAKLPLYCGATERSCGGTGLNVNFANAIKVAATTTATGASTVGTALDCYFAYR
jgi:hypothetical protein